MYQISDKLDRDLNQTKLSSSGCVSNIAKYAKKDLQINFNEMVLCPFCLEWSEWHLFKRTKGFYECIHCHNHMTFKTAYNIRKMNPREFAKWVFDYRMNGFFSKINFQKWNNNLYEYGLSFEFWQEYKKLRGDNLNEKQYDA